MEWQPIETAPRDGTPVLVWLGHRLIEAMWDAEDYGPDTDDWTGCWRIRWAEIDSFGLHPDEPPTHWMPIPVPPDMGVSSPTENTQATSDA